MRDSDWTNPETDEAAPSAWVPDDQSSFPSRNSSSTAVAKGLIVKALQRLNSPDGRLTAEPRDPPLNSGRLDAFCDALVSADAEAAARVLMALEADGSGPGVRSLDYIIGAARRMGERWSNDSASFLDVTQASGRLLGLVRDLSDQYDSLPADPVPGQEILIATVPGETHSLGANIAAEVFRRGRWDVTLLDGADASQIAASLAARDYPVVGLSAGSRRMIPVLGETVQLVRRVRANAVICVGGPILELEPEIVQMVRADRAGADPSVACLLFRGQASFPALGTGFRHAK